MTYWLMQDEMVLMNTIQDYLANDFAALTPLHEGDSSVEFLLHYAVYIRKV